MTRTQTRLINPNFRLQEVAGFQRKLGPDLLGQDHPASFVHRDCDHGIKNGIWYSLSQGLPARVKKSKLTLKSGSPCPGANAGVESCRDRKNGSATNGAKFRAVWDAALAGQIVVFPRDPWVAPQPRARGLHPVGAELSAIRCCPYLPFTATTSLTWSICRGKISPTSSRERLPTENGRQGILP